MVPQGRAVDLHSPQAPEGAVIQGSLRRGETLLVVGKDIQGPWWAEIGVQDGMPAGCHVMNEAGADWGSFIEIAGVAWPKAIGFASETGPVPLGGRYPGGTRFCLDADARVYLATNRQ